MGIELSHAEHSQPAWVRPDLDRPKGHHLAIDVEDAWARGRPWRRLESKSLELEKRESALTQMRA